MLRADSGSATRVAPAIAATDGRLERRRAGAAIELSLTTLTGDVRQFRPFRLESPASGWTSPPSRRCRPGSCSTRRRPRASPGTRCRPRCGSRDRPPTRPRASSAWSTTATCSRPRTSGPTSWLTGCPTATAGGNFGPGLQIMLAPDGDRRGAVAAGPPRRQRGARGPDPLRHDPGPKEIAKQLALIRWIFLGMAGLVLLIGVAGILNVGLATVGERVEEFALRRAVGTPRSLLAGIVLAETLLTGLLHGGRRDRVVGARPDRGQPSSSAARSRSCGISSSRGRPGSRGSSPAWSPGCSAASSRPSGPPGSRSPPSCGPDREVGRHAFPGPPPRGGGPRWVGYPYAPRRWPAGRDQGAIR